MRLRLKARRKRLFKRKMLKSAGFRAKGAVKSEIKCGLEGCDNRINILAKQMGDSFCSRECAEKYIGGAA